MTQKLCKHLCLPPLFAFLLFNLAALTPAFADHDGDPEPMIVTGDLTVMQVDDFENHQSEIKYLLQDSTMGKTFYLHFDKMPAVKLVTGMKVKVHGVGKGNQLTVAANGNNVETLSVAAATVSGAQNTIVILLNFIDATIECGNSSVNGLMFQNTASVNTLYQETSYGNVSFSGVVAGPYTINYYSTNTCDYGSWASAAESAASAAGYNVSSYNRRVYVFPKNNPCGWAGMGTIGGNPSKAWIAYCDLADVFAHELGHNVNMHHASTPTCEYCDVSDFMGYGGVGFRQVNAPHKEEMGWLPTGKVVLATGNTTVNIAPLELYPSSTALPQALKIAKPDTAEYYYFSFRRKLGFDSSLGTDYADKANIHRYKGSGSIQTFFLGSLATGQSFNDAANGFTVTSLATTADYVTLQVSFGCASLAPMVTISPASQSGNAGATLNYTVQISNRDSSSCPATTFTLTPTVPGGWTVAVSSPLALLPGISGSATLTVTSTLGAVAGNYSVGVSVSDGVSSTHNGSASATYAVNVVDTSAPTAPSNLVASSKRGKAQLTWNASSDNVGVVNYCVWRNGVKIAQPTSTSYLDGAVTAGATYSYSITAMDAAGNTSGQSNTSSLTVSKGGKP
ncbi:MAG TPA: hypothetical protein VFA77_08180 [Candidatus Eisenbacteria bacterium]|nr:hypothetical protein [Candidatus Eisenbacteria bacterium]